MNYETLSVSGETLDNPYNLLYNDVTVKRVRQQTEDKMDVKQQQQRIENAYQEWQAAEKEVSRFESRVGEMTPIQENECNRLERQASKLQGIWMGLVESFTGERVS